MAECAVNDQASHAETDDQGGDPKQNEGPKGVSLRLRQKFEALKNRRQNLSKGYRERQMRLKKETDDEQRKDAEQLEVEARESSVGLEKTNKPKTYTADNKSESSEQNNWSGIQQFLDCNSHLTVDQGKPAPKSGLAKRIDEAIEKGDFSTAEKLSDQLASREFAVKITSAIDAREFSSKRKKEEEVRKSKRQKKLHWGFEHKEKWEMKANM